MTGSDYMALVKRLPCVLHVALGEMPRFPTEAHHVRAGQGMGQRAGDFCVAALCVECHRGILGVHGDRTTMKILKLSEMDLLDLTIKAAVELLVKEGSSGPY